MRRTSLASCKGMHQKKLTLNLYGHSRMEQKQSATQFLQTLYAQWKTGSNTRDHMAYICGGGDGTAYVVTTRLPATSLEAVIVAHKKAEQKSAQPF